MQTIVSAALIMALSIAIIGVVLKFGVPLVENRIGEFEFEHGKSLVNFFYVTASELYGEPINSSREQEIEFSSGVLKFSENTISFTILDQNYNKTLQDVRFNEIEIPPGRTRIKLTKIDKDKINVKIE